MRQILTLIQIGIVLFTCTQGNSKNLSEIFVQKDRPGIHELSSLHTDSPNWEPPAPPKTPIQDSLDLYLGATQIILKLLVNQKVFLLARDMDELHDFIDYYLSKHPEAEILRKNLIRLPISRLVAKEPYSFLEPWMKKHGLSPNDLIEGKMNASFIDIGWRGQIYKNIINGIIENSVLPASFRERALGLFSHLNFYLLGTYKDETVSAVIDDIRADRIASPQQLKMTLGGDFFSFKNLFDLDQSVNNRIFNSESHAVRIDFVHKRVKIFFRHWNPRGIRLSADGQALSAFESNTSPDAAVDRVEMIKRLWAIRRFVDSQTTSSVLDQHLSLILQKMSPSEIAAGMEFQVSPEIRVKILSLVHTGKSAKVFMVKDVQSERLYALKIPVDGTLEAKQALDRSLSRLNRLNELEVPHSRTITTAPNLILKTWVPVTAKVWLVQLKPESQIESEASFKQLVYFFKNLIERGIYIRNLSPSNLGFDGDQPTVIDSSSIQTISEEEARELWEKSIAKHWAPVSPYCAQLLSKELFQ